MPAPGAFVSHAGILVPYATARALPGTAISSRSRTWAPVSKRDPSDPVVSAQVPFPGHLIVDASAKAVAQGTSAPSIDQSLPQEKIRDLPPHQGSPLSVRVHPIVIRRLGLIPRAHHEAA